METIKQRRGYALGVDPGSTTGLTLVRFDLEGGMPGVAWSEQLSWEEAAMQVARVLRRISKMPGVEATAAACEKFTISAQTAQRGQGPAEDTLGMNGVVRHYCLKYGVALGQLETPSSAKAVISDPVLKALRLHQPGRKHCNDATRQACLYANKNGWLPNRLLGLALA